MKVTVYLRVPSGVQAVEVAGATMTRNEKPNRHGAKPAVLAVLTKTDGQYESYAVAAEFNAADVIGWVADEDGK